MTLAGIAMAMVTISGVLSPLETTFLALFVLSAEGRRAGVAGKVVPA